jgi:hypothetical protein
MVRDDHSRFALSLLACASEQHASEQAALTTLFRPYGLPVRILCANGAPWGSAGGLPPWILLSVWLAHLGMARAVMAARAISKRRAKNAGQRGTLPPDTPHRSPLYT